jgi:hypothetical protein
MKTRILFAAAAAISTVVLAGAAGATVTVSTSVTNQLNSYNSGTLLDNFDGFVAPHVSFVGNITATQDPVSTAAAPPYTGLGSISICCQGGSNYLADATKFESVEGGQTSTFSTTGGYYLTSFSFYMGSPDYYNHMLFHFSGGGSQQIDGNAIWGGSPAGNGDRTKGFRVYYNFHGAHVSSIDFSSGQNAFEADNFAGGVGVPEPASWALMITGFGLAGGMIRAKRRAAATA